jgi:anti-sigma B factor antagonist
MLAQTEGRLDGPLTIERTRYGDDVLAFSLSGELDLAVVGAARRLIEPAFAERGAMVIIDLTELEFIDSSGVALLYALAKAHPDPEALRLLRSRHDAVNRMLDMTAVDSVVRTVSSPAS